MPEIVVTEQAVKAAAAKIAGPTVWAETWRRPHFENIARSALAAAAPKLDVQHELDAADRVVLGLEALTSWPSRARPDDVHRLRERPMPSPTDEQLGSPAFAAVWETIKSWNINVPEHYDGYCGANGSHVALILNALGEGEAYA